jgi:hypothetical protein
MSDERKSRYELFLEEEACTAQPTKRCSKCGKTKALSDFNKDKRTKSGVVSPCRQCRGVDNPVDRIDMFWKHYHRSTKRVGECLEWTGAYKTDGYPAYMWRKSAGDKPKQTPVIRLVYSLAIGALGDGDIVLLSCDNRRCVRHSHLKLGSKTDREIKRQRKAATGDNHGLNLHPERRQRGDMHWSRRHPEKVKRGDDHPIRQRPDLLPHGDGHWTKLHPEKKSRGEELSWSKLKESDVRSIRSMAAHGNLYREIAHLFGIAKGSVSAIVRRETWKHVE